MKALLVALLLAAAASGAEFTHFTGTAAPSGFTVSGTTLADANGVICMNGTLVGGAGGTCSAAVSGESFLNMVTAANADAALVYRTTAVSLTTSKLYRISWRNSTTGASYIWLSDGLPTEGTNAGVFGATGKALLRIEAQNSGANIGISRYEPTARTRTQWNTGTSAWATPTVNATTTLTGSYQEILLEIDGPNRRWRVGVVGQTGTANTPTTGLYLAALTDWTLFSFHEGGSIFCNPTCGSVYLAVGEPLTDAATATVFVESYEELDGTATDIWLNGRDAGGAWDIYHYSMLTDVDGFPGYAMPDDRTSKALTRGGAGAWDESHVKDQFVLQDGATYHMAYSGFRASDGKAQIGFASATSAAGPWTKNANNPIVALVAAGQRDQVLNPTLIKDEGEPDAAKRWKILFIGADTSSPIRFRAFETHCSQPPTHTSCDTAAEWSAPVLIWDVGAGGSIDEVGVGRVLPLRVDGVNYLFGGVRGLSGGAATNRQETYATTADRWLSAVSKTGTVSNASAVSSGRTSTTAAITTTGSRTFTVADSSGFLADDLVVVDDDATTGNFRMNRVLRVASATSLVMYHNEDSLASGGLVRKPAGFQQIDVGPVLKVGSSYVKYATCFDAMAGGGSTLDAYVEVTCQWRGPSALGPWTLHRNSPISPLSAFSRGASNENPSLVNLPIPASVRGFAPGAFGRTIPPFLPRSF